MRAPTDSARVSRTPARATSTRLTAGSLGIALACGCGHAANDAKIPVQHEPASAQISRIARRWQAFTQDKGFRSAPSPISVFEIQLKSSLDLEQAGANARETLQVSEQFELRDGRRFHCESQQVVAVEARYGFRQNEPALELRRPALRLARHCTPPDYPEAVLELPAEASRFVLSDDQLRAFAPKRDRRVYLPID
jgi:hypothetical protein